LKPYRLTGLFRAKVRAAREHLRLPAGRRRTCRSGRFCGLCSLPLYLPIPVHVHGTGDAL
jgi:hypothetical protein